MPIVDLYVQLFRPGVVVVYDGAVHTIEYNILRNGEPYVKLEGVEARVNCARLECPMTHFSVEVQK